MQVKKQYKIDSDKIAWRIIDDEAVILNLDTALYYSLDKIGTKVWLFLSEGKTIEDATNVIANEYEVEEQKIKEDFLDLVDELKREGLIDETTRRG